jgi:signal transduction histidine kinase
VSYRRDVPLEQPLRQLARGLLASGRRDADTGLQQLVTVVIIVVTALSTEPLGWTGHGLATVIVLVICSALLASRHLSSSVIPDPRRLILLLAGAVAAAAMVALSRHGTGYLFAFYLAGHAGYRLVAADALKVAVACSVLSGGVLLLHIGVGHHNLPWLVGAATGFSVLVGMVSRSQQQALASALSAADSAERAAQAEAREAVLAERGRIARDVHDVLAHSLAGINMQLEVADALLETGDVQRARAATQRAQSLVRESLVESQRTVRALREDTLPLVETLQALLDSSTTAQRLDVIGTVREVDTRSAQNLVRIAQEALTNAAKHAAGALVHARLTYAAATVELEVVNERPEAAPVNDSGSGMGLVGMRERAALLNGSVSAGPVLTGPHAGGWSVQAIIPA